MVLGRADTDHQSCSATPAPWRIDRDSFSPRAQPRRVRTHAHKPFLESAADGPAGTAAAAAFERRVFFLSPNNQRPRPRSNQRPLPPRIHPIPESLRPTIPFTAASPARSTSELAATARDLRPLQLAARRRSLVLLDGCIARSPHPCSVPIDHLHSIRPMVQNPTRTFTQGAIGSREGARPSTSRHVIVPGGWV